MGTFALSLILIRSSQWIVLQKVDNEALILLSLLTLRLVSWVHVLKATVLLQVDLTPEMLILVFSNRPIPFSPGT